MNFIFNTEYSILFVIILLALSVLISYYTYRNSKINNPVKFILRLLRFLSIFLILFLLISPFIKTLKVFNQKPLNLILIDNSASLNIEERKNSLLNYLKENLNYYNNSESETKLFLFSGGLTKEIQENDIDSIKFDENEGFETNLSSALGSIAEKYKDRRISAINIISDGIINAGGNPANQEKNPNTVINYYLIGDTVQKKDLVLEELNLNKYAFIESSVPVKAIISSYHYNKQVKINLYEENLLKDSKVINVDGNNIRYAVTFLLSSPVEAVKKYRIEIEPEQDEITTKNNSEEFLVKFLNNKIKVLVLSGGPGPDFAYLSQEIKKINNFEAKFLTQKSANEFYEGSLDNFNNYQLFILAGFPTSITNTSLLLDLKERLSRKNSGVILIAGKSVDYSRLSIIDNYLPFQAGNLSNSEITSGLSSVINNSPEQNNFKSLNSINSFPNVFRPASKIPVKPQAETIIVFSSDREPAIFISNTIDNKSAAFMFYGFYKWRLNPLSINSDEVLNSLITGSALSIIEKEKGSRFFVGTSKQIYAPGENIIFNAGLNDFELKGNEKIRVRIYNDSYNKELELEKTNNLNFSGNLKIENPGDYNYLAEMISGGEVIDKTTNKIIVGENHLEYKETKANESILNQLSSSSGGKRFNGLSNNELKGFLTKISENLQEKLEYTEKTYLSSDFYYLIIVVLLLAIEWFLRKRNNLP